MNDTCYRQSSFYIRLSNYGESFASYHYVLIEGNPIRMVLTYTILSMMGIKGCCLVLTRYILLRVY